jgi:hypothetical protein
MKAVSSYLPTETEECQESHLSVADHVGKNRERHMLNEAVHQTDCRLHDYTTHIDVHNLLSFMLFE